MFFSHKPVVVQLEATNLVWQGMRDPDTGQWIGVCNALNLNAIGDTWMDLQACAAEAITLLLLDLFEDGELDAFLREHGWRKLTPLPRPGTAQPAFDVPFSWDRAESIKELIPA